MTTQKPNPKTGRESFGLTDQEIITGLEGKLDATTAAFNELIVAVRGGGYLGPAVDTAQAFLDALEEGKHEEPLQVPAQPDFASDEAAEFAASMNAAGKLSTDQISQIKGTGKKGDITVADVEAAVKELNTD